MPKITICERPSASSSASEGFAAAVRISGAEYPIVVRDPFDEQQEQLLEWYFERWLERPYVKAYGLRAETARQSIRDYGEALFDQVFADRRAYKGYADLRENLEQVQIEIEGSPAFQALHWEALREPLDEPTDGSRPNLPLSVDCMMLRKLGKAGSVRVDESPVVNLLVVVARPGEENDVGYRTIARPLIETIGKSQLRVNVDILRPGTYEAFVKQLDQKGAGYYHIVHFDMHGSLTSYADLMAINDRDDEESSLTYRRVIDQRRFGRDDLQPFEGKRAFLIFEGEVRGELDCVEASELVQRLKNKRIPVCLLNACQSAKQMSGVASEAEEALLDVQETSLGAQMMAAGMQVVVAMGYSVTVSAAKILMETLYSSLLAQAAQDADVVRAIWTGRRELHDRKRRRANWNMEILLEDWLLPVVYASGEVDLNLRKFQPEEEEAYYNAEDGRYRFDADAQRPTFGFVGRDLEILKIEKALLRHNVLLLQGMGGTGKTTLLNYLRDWWQRTNFAVDIFYFGYDQKAYTLQQTLQAIGQRVFKKFEFASFQAMGLGAQRRKLAEALKAERYVIVLDNLESVTGEPLAIQNTLPEAEQGEVRKFLLALKGGQTKVVLGSRSDEAWLQETFEQNRYRLRGLDREARTVLAEKILDATSLGPQEIETIRQDDEFERLLGLLEGYPLAMEVVLPNLARQSVAEVLSAMDAADVDLDSGTEDKTKSILKCVEYSHSNLSGNAQKLLLCLAPFKGVIHRDKLPNYVAKLKKLKPFAEWEFDQFESAVDEALRWGLLSPYLDGEDGRLLKIQPVFPYFLKAKLADMDEAVAEGLATGFKEHYRELAAQYQQMMGSKEPEQRKLGLFFCGLEYENLFNALQICLRRKEAFSIFFCLNKYLDLSQSLKEGLKLAEYTNQILQTYPTETLHGNIGLDRVGASDILAYYQFQTKQYKSARTTYQNELSLLEKITSVDAVRKQTQVAVTYHQLGYVAQAQRDYAQATAHYQQALAIKVEFGDRYEQAAIYHQLGIVAQAQRDYAQATAHYQQALAIKVEFGDRYSQASTYGQIGLLAEAQEDYPQAQQHLQQALEIFATSNDEHSVEIALQSLARLHKTTQDDNLLTDIAKLLNATVEEVTQLFDKLNNGSAD